MSSQDFTDEQKNYLQGFVAGSGMSRVAARTAGGAAAPGTGGAAAKPAGPEAIHHAAQDRFLAEGKKLCNEEQAKREKNPLDMWDEVREHADAGRFPKGTDVFCFKFHGPVLRRPGAGRVHVPPAPARRRRSAASSSAGVADLAEQLRRRLRRRDHPRQPPDPRDRARRTPSTLLDGPARAGHRHPRLRRRQPAQHHRQPHRRHRPARADRHAAAGQGACTTTSCNHRELYGLPRKFNIAFDGGGAVAQLADTNDIGFVAVRVGEGRDADGKPVPPGVYFRLQLGGITGHKDFARDTRRAARARRSACRSPSAIVRVFIEHGDRTDRKKARLKYVLDRTGASTSFVAETEKHLPPPAPRRVAARSAASRRAAGPLRPRRRPPAEAAGAVLRRRRAAGRPDDVRRRCAAWPTIAERHGSGTIRLTVWQNLLISDIAEASRGGEARVEALGLGWSATAVRAGLVACTGNAGCKFAATDTKRHAMADRRATSTPRRRRSTRRSTST